MGNCWSSLKGSLRCSHDGSTTGLQQGVQNPPSGPPSGSGLQNPLSGPSKSPQTALPTLQDHIKLFKETADKCNIDALIQAIDQLLKSKLNHASTSTSTAHTSSGSTDFIPNWKSGVHNGATFLKFVDEHTQKIDANVSIRYFYVKKRHTFFFWFDRKRMAIDLQDDFFRSGQGQKVVGEILQQLGQLHWIVGGLSIIAYLLDKVEKVSKNRSECLHLLKCMFDLATHVKKLKGQMPEEEGKLRDAFALIVEGCMTCASQLHSGKNFRFLRSSVDCQALNDLSLKVNRLYEDLTLTVVIDIKKDQPSYLPVLHPAYPEGAVGLEKPLGELRKKLDLQTTNVSSCVVIYGVGGIGKTTLANALVATLADDLKHYNYTKVEINEDPLKNDFKSMQTQILKDCFPIYESGREILLRNCEEGRTRLKEAFNCGTKNPVFLFIDNALRSKDLKELLPENLRAFPNGSRILLTTRNLAETDLFEERGIPRHDYAVNTLAKEDALQILCNDPTHLNLIANHVEKITQIASGIPLVLKIVGAHLRKAKYKVENCSQILNALEQGGDVMEEDLSERLVRFVYNGLELSTKEAFLDICFLFNGWTRRKVEYIVGVEEVRSLEEAALLTSLPYFNSVDNIKTLMDFFIVGEEKVVVHDVIQAKGRNMGESTRIKDWSRVAKCQVIKGVDLRDQNAVIEESQLNSMNDSLRILDCIRISGRSSETFKELRYLRLDGVKDLRCFPMNLEGLPSLSYYEGPMSQEVVNKASACMHFHKNFTFKSFSTFKILLTCKLKFTLHLPQSLKYLSAIGSSYSDIGECSSLKESNSIQTFRNSSLVELYLYMREDMLVMLDGRLHFDALKILSFVRLENMEELPHQVCGLSSLNKLILSFSELKRLPESIANLRALTHLDLGWCQKLEEVSSSLGKLSALRYLNLSYCWKLRSLPDNFVQLPSLEVLWMEGGVDKLLVRFGQIDKKWKIIV